MCGGERILVVVISAAARANLTTVEIVETGRVVVAVETRRLVIGVGLVDVGTDKVKPVNMPALWFSPSPLSRMRTG